MLCVPVSVCDAQPRQDLEPIHPQVLRDGGLAQQPQQATAMPQLGSLEVAGRPAAAAARLTPDPLLCELHVPEPNRDKLGNLESSRAPGFSRTSTGALLPV